MVNCPNINLFSYFWLPFLEISPLQKLLYCEILGPTHSISPFGMLLQALSVLNAVAFSVKLGRPFLAAISSTYRCAFAALNEKHAAVAVVVAVIAVVDVIGIVVYGIAVAVDG